MIYVKNISPIDVNVYIYIKPGILKNNPITCHRRMAEPYGNTDPYN